MFRLVPVQFYAQLVLLYDTTTTRWLIIWNCVGFLCHLVYLHTNVLGLITAVGNGPSICLWRCAGTRRSSVAIVALDLTAAASAGQQHQEPVLARCKFSLIFDIIWHQSILLLETQHEHIQHHQQLGQGEAEREQLFSTTSAAAASQQGRQREQW